MAVNVGLKDWACSECGHKLTDDNPPYVCPMCEAVDAYYEHNEEE